MKLVPHVSKTVRKNTKFKNAIESRQSTFLTKTSISYLRGLKGVPPDGLLTRATRLLALILCGLLLGSSALQAEEISQEYQLKLAFLVNFARFISWPEESFSQSNDQLNLCIVGDNPFGTSLQGVDNKPVGSRRLKVNVLQSEAEADTCQLLYISQSTLNRLPELNTNLATKPIVTVSDTAGFISSGGAIELLIKDERLTFVINNTKLKDLGVVASSAMLNLAASVR